MRRTALATMMAALSFGCDAQRVEESTTDRYRFDITDGTRIEVRIDDGDIEVVNGAASEIVVTVTKRVRAADRQSAAAVLDSHPATAAMTDELVHVRARTSVGSLISVRGSVTTDVRIAVPRDTPPLDLRTGDGNIRLEELSGTIRAETGDGRVRLTNVAGELELRSSDGSLRGRGLAGRVDAWSGDGRIDLEGAFRQLRAVTADGNVRVRCEQPCDASDEWQLRTMDGSVELRVPEGLSARLEAVSNDGRVRHRLSSFDGKQSESRLAGTIGSGGALILITTMDGRVSVEES